jgi:hypothetical protein
LNADAWTQSHDLRLTAYITSVLCNSECNRLLFRINYEEKISSYYNIDFEHVCVLDLHSWHGYNAAQCVDSTRVRIIVLQTAA